VNEITDPYRTLSEREQDMVHARELEKIRLTHERRTILIERTSEATPILSIAIAVLGLGIFMAWTVPSCTASSAEESRRVNELVDVCIREGTSAADCRCAYSTRVRCDE
jgi:hypothetical protein